MWRHFGKRGFGWTAVAVSENPGEARDIWNEVGLRIAVTGGMYPLLLAVGLLSVATCVWWFDGLSLASGAYALMLQLLATLAVGFPYLVFGGFLLSVLITVPLVGAIAQAVKRGSIRVSPWLATMIGIALMIAVWTVMFYVAAILCMHHY